MARVLATAVLGLLLLGGTAASGSTHAAERCAHTGRTLASGSAFRVYLVKVKTEPRTYGCVRSSGRRRRLDLNCAHPPDGLARAADACIDRPSKVVLHRRWVALEFRGFDGGGGGSTETHIVRADLRSSLRRYTSILDDQGSDGRSPIVDRLFVSPRGGEAYSSDDLNEGEGRTGLVGYVLPPKNGRNQGERFLDFSPGVVGDSLRVGGGLIHWMNRDVAKTAPWR
jgi:hypothetical protein